jgi:hypothetical protein
MAPYAVRLPVRHNKMVKAQHKGDCFFSPLLSNPPLTSKFDSAINFLIRKQEGSWGRNMSNQKKYYLIEYAAEIVEANSQSEAIAIAKERIQDRDVEVDEENTCQVEDKELLKEIEDGEKRADKEEAKTTAN